MVQCGFVCKSTGKRCVSGAGICGFCVRHYCISAGLSQRSVLKRMVGG